ncbi:MAG: nucleotidyltransferase domain-containing protein, partial [Candidatus Parvarchaeota archaeon]|nr:nucleotidyltransferase domain-containing protein [Candidatus Parvarchaeota archaeon]
MSFNDLIMYLSSKNIGFLNIEKELKGYILAFANKLEGIESMRGAVLFGSVARGTYTKDSDIDI